MPKKTYLDTNILISAAVGTRKISQQALEIIQDEDREFVGSDFLKLETLPKAIYMKNDNEAEFYRTFFELCETWVTFETKHVNLAFEHASKIGASAIDTFHLIFAVQERVEEFITNEKEGRGMFRSDLVPISRLG